MNGRVLDVWRTAWPIAIPVHEYEAALQMAALIGIIGRKPEAESAREPERPAAKKTPGDLIHPKEAARMLGRKNPATVYVLAKKGDLTTYLVDGKKRFSRAEVAALDPRRNTGPRLVHSQPAGDGLLSTAEAGRMAGVSEQVALVAARSGALRTQSGGGKGNPRRFAREAVEAWIAARNAPAKSEG